VRAQNIKIIGEKGAMNELALFAGAGGGILGGQLLGWRTVCAVEIEPYPASVLMQRQNDGLLPNFPIWDDVCTFDGRPWRGIVDVVSGGFPCQDISAAGKGAGIDGERSGLWTEFARIICEIQPRYAFIENSPMLTLRGLDRVLCDLAEMGFDAKWGVVSAADVGAPHRRERIWIVATNTYGNKCTAGNQQQKQSGSAATADGINEMANALQPRLQRRKNNRSSNKIRPRKNKLTSRRFTHIDGRRVWELEPSVGRVANELAAGMDILGANGGKAI
jgi:DNA (cytosine-5)-methyltransferase 1